MSDFDIMNVQIEEPKQNFDDYAYTIYGVAGVGKSTLCQNLFQDPAFLTLDNNHEHIRAKKLPAPDWKTVKNYTKTLTKAFADGQDMPFKTLIVDTAGVGAKLCQDAVCRANGWSHPKDGDYGQGWDAVKTEWNMTWKAFRDCGIKVVFVVHDKDKEFKVRNGESYNQIVPDLGATFLGEVVNNVNFVFYITKELEHDKDGNVIGEKRVIHSRQTSEYLAKSHFANFPEHIDYQETPEATAKLIREEFDKACKLEFGGNKAPKQEKPVTKPASKPKKEVANEEPTTEIKTQDGSLDDYKTLIETKLRDKLQSKEMTAQDIISIVEKYAGVKMIKDIDSLDKAKALLEAIQ